MIIHGSCKLKEEAQNRVERSGAIGRLNLPKGRGLVIDNHSSYVVKLSYVS